MYVFDKKYKLLMLGMGLSLRSITLRSFVTLIKNMSQQGVTSTIVTDICGSDWKDNQIWFCKLVDCCSSIVNRFCAPVSSSIVNAAFLYYTKERGKYELCFLVHVCVQNESQIKNHLHSCNVICECRGNYGCNKNLKFTKKTTGFVNYKWQSKLIYQFQYLWRFSWKLHWKRRLR